MARLTLLNVRLSFAQQLWVPGVFPGSAPGTPPRWSCSFLLDPKNPEHAKQSAAIDVFEREEFAKKCGADFDKKWKALDWDDHCLRNGDKKPEWGLEGLMYVAANATEGKQAQPIVLTRNRTPVGQGGVGAPYAGCYVNGQIEIWAQYGTYKRVNATLLGVQFMRDGDAFGGGAPADPNAFPDLGDQGEEDLSELA